MAMVREEFGIANDLRTGAPAQHYSTIVKFIKEVAKETINEAPISVEIFTNGGQWYCQVCRGNEKTRPMGPYTKLQAERMQDARRRLIAKEGAARLVFEVGRGSTDSN